MLLLHHFFKNVAYVLYLLKYNYIYAAKTQQIWQNMQILE